MKVLVTGGGGFLGGGIARALRSKGHMVRSFSRGVYPELVSLGIETMRGDISDKEAVSRAISGMDAVIHSAAKAGIWGSYSEYFSTNVQGTQHVIEACRAHGVKRLVYTSSPSVTFAGVDQDLVDESVPYATNFLAHYPDTKAEAEIDVLAANDARLATVALRPHLIWGPGDNHLVPRILDKARAGKLRLIDGGKSLVDSTYIDNAIDAHLLSLERLDIANPKANTIAGKAYFISNGEPIPMGQLINRILACAGMPPVTRSVPLQLAIAAGWCCEQLYTVLSLTGEPPITRFVALQLGTCHSFNISAARRDLNYHPKVSIDEGMARLRQELSGNQGAIVQKL